MKSSFAPIRKHLRVAWRTPVTIKVLSDETEFQAMTRNVSSHGISAFVPERVPVNTTVAVELELFHGDQALSVEAKGKVVRQEPDTQNTVAISFTQLDDSVRARLRHAVFQQAMLLMERISEFPAFWDLSELDLLALTSICHEATLEAGEALARLGDEATSLFLVKSGRVQLRAPFSTTGIDAEVDVAHTGQVFGEVSALLGMPHHLDIVALDYTELLVIPREALVYLRDHNPNFAVSLYEIFAAFMGRRLRKLTGRLFSPVSF